MPAQLADTSVITEFTLASYQIDLQPSLPVGKQRIDNRQGLILNLRLCDNDNEQQEFVEIAPLSGHDIDGQPISSFSPESLEQVTSYLQTQLPTVLGKPISSLYELIDDCDFACVQFSLSLLHAKFTSSFNQGLADDREAPLVYDGMSDSTLKQKLDKAEHHAIKVKVAQTDMASEIKFIHKILELKPKLRLRLDANRGLTLEQACELLTCIPKASVDYIEEPCIHMKDNPAVYQSIGVKYALDESLLKPEFTLLSTNGVPEPGLAALVIKPGLYGSIDKLQRLIEQANEHGIRCILSSGLESDVAINDLRKLSHALTPDDIPGLDTLAPFTQRLYRANPTDSATGSAMGKGMSEQLDMSLLKVIAQQSLVSA
ncbi:o-succinylbenzoate synthase [Shewanella maritima]|uniref:o-succinylbenzoate synthase n=1 Tax=Shewanella maritima TaxID=2520507 RepID=A0A411PH95_9GAMM|nr:o-succinylbenzoate synthase [Shewanella maritima]QBF82730.1 o-succinylbenzoate synthase [Shewanella maritima]